MAGPARAGLFIYAKDLERVAGFYAAVLGMRRAQPYPDMAVLDSPDMQLLVHAIPAAYAASIAIATPPEPREETPLKFFFTVDRLAATAEIVAAHGGVMFSEQWAGPGFVVRNACDPEGNIFQLREPAP